MLSQQITERVVHRRVIGHMTVPIEHKLMEPARITRPGPTRGRMEENPEDRVQRTVIGVDPIGYDFTGEELLS